MVPARGAIQFYAPGGTIEFYRDADHYDRMVDNHCFPSCFDDGDDLGLTPADARRTHFQNVAADAGTTNSGAAPGDTPRDGS
jgi:hypothetical protein